jgi:hypothetical protein
MPGCSGGGGSVVRFCAVVGGPVGEVVAGPLVGGALVGGALVVDEAVALEGVVDGDAAVGVPLVVVGT